MNNNRYYSQETHNSDYYSTASRSVNFNPMQISNLILPPPAPRPRHISTPSLLSDDGLFPNYANVDPHANNLLTDAGGDNLPAAANDNKEDEQEELPIYQNSQPELTEDYIRDHIRLPIHPTACVICRVCLYCSQLHGSTVCNCAGAGRKLPPKRRGARGLNFDFCSPALRSFTVDWIKKHANELYQPLFYLTAVDSCTVNVCTNHYNSYLKARNQTFPSTINNDHPPRLLPGTFEYQQHELQRMHVLWPLNHAKYMFKHSVGWDVGLNVKMMKRKDNKMDDSRETPKAIDTTPPKIKCNKSDDENSNNNDNNNENNNNDNNNNNNNNNISLVEEDPQQSSSNKRKGKAVAATNTTTEDINKKKKTKSEEEYERSDPLEYVTVSIWNAPSKYTWKLINFDHLSPIPQLYPIENGPANCLLFDKIVIKRDVPVGSLFQLKKVIRTGEILPAIVHAENEKIKKEKNKGKGRNKTNGAQEIVKTEDLSFSLDQTRFLCVKDWKFEIDMDQDFNQFLLAGDSLLIDGHLDFYIGYTAKKNRLG